jgi:hypothetical protein
MIAGLSGCGATRVTKSSAANPDQAKASQMCDAIADYVSSHPELDAEMKRDLEKVTMSNYVTNGVGIEFKGGWCWSRADNALQNYGFWIGNEHTWYEITFRAVSNKLSVTDATERRERVRIK